MKACFLTGQSNRRSCELSAAQKKIANVLSEDGVTVSPLNFPYRSHMGKQKPVNIITASFSNGAQYYFSRNKSFLKKYRTSVVKQFSGPCQYIVFAGSCGLELLTNLQLPQALLDRMHVIAYGPVARALPNAHVITVQGEDDWISRCFIKKVDHIVPCGHMNYLESEEVVALFRRIVRVIKKNSGDA